MEITASASKRTLAPEGTHIARCVRILDLGTQTSEYEGKESSARKVQLSFELIGQNFIIREGQADEAEVPFIVHKEYTASIGPKANLAKDLTSWTGKKIDPNVSFNIESMLGRECQIQLVTATSKAGREYTKLTAIMGVPAKMKVGKAESPLIFLSLDPAEFEQEVFDALNPYLQETILLSPEATELGLELSTPKEEAKPAAAKSKPAAPKTVQKPVAKGKKTPF